MASHATAVMDERVVQTWALHYLHSRYAKTHPDQRIFADAEMLLKKQSEAKRGYDRVDGLVCIAKPGGYYSVAIEAKSMKTAYSLVTASREGSTTQNVLIASILVIPLVIVLVIFWSFAWYWILLLAAGTLILSLLIVGIYDNSPYLLTTSVHEQLTKYAGNDKWLALPQDARQHLVKANQWDRFLKICKRAGFGLVTVSNDGLVTEWQTPRTSKGDFVHFYKQEQDIRNYLAGQPSSLINYFNCLSFKSKLKSIECSNPHAQVVTPKF